MLVVFDVVGVVVGVYCLALRRSRRWAVRGKASASSGVGGVVVTRLNFWVRSVIDRGLFFVDVVRREGIVDRFRFLRIRLILGRGVGVGLTSFLWRFWRGSGVV